MSSSKDFEAIPIVGLSKKKDKKPLQDFTKEEYIAEIETLQAHIKQLRNIIAKGNNKEASHREKKKTSKRKFEFEKCNTRHVALKIAYLGWDYHGFAVQEDNNATIEAELFDALITAKLIKSRETSSYHRCGRTDKGVSAFSQVISIDLRSNFSEGLGVKPPEIMDSNASEQSKSGNDKSELPYVQIMNRLLPPEIRVLAWAPVSEDFSARFSCTRRQYKYYFPRGQLNLEWMREAGTHLVGTHDFRNLCKMDVGNAVTNYIRHINYVSLRTLDDRDSEYTICELTVDGKAFLWHQIRCIVEVLLMIGQGKEQPQVILDLLDVTAHPCKPQYAMASELPLVLYDCEFEDVEWQYEADLLTDNMRTLQTIWSQHAIKCSMITGMLGDLSQKKRSLLSDSGGDHIEPQSDHLSNTVCGETRKKHQPLLQRNVCPSLEDRIDHFVKRRRLTPQTANESSEANSDDTNA